MILASYLIIGVTVFLNLGVVVTFTISVTLGHVNPLWCYISYTGNYPVESCIFSAVMSLSSTVYFLIVYIRYFQLYYLISDSSHPKRMAILNLASFVIACLGILGLSIAGSFQQRVFHLLHIVGVFFCTTFLFLYFIFQTYFTFVLRSLVTSVAMKSLRVVTVVISFCILATGLFFVIFLSVRRKCRFDLTLASVPADGGFNMGAVFEWILFIVYQAFVFTFYSNFKNIAVGRDKIVFLENDLH